MGGPSLSVDKIMSGEKVLGCIESLCVTDPGLLHVGDNSVARSAYMAPSQWDQDLLLVHNLTFWSPLLMAGCLAQP